MATDADTADGELTEMVGPRGARRAAAAALVMVLAMTALVGWLAYRDHRSQAFEADQQMFVAAGRQVAENLTTIDWAQAEADVERVLDSAAGSFHEEFSQRSADFIDVVKKARSKSEGTISEVGLESESEGNAVVLVVAAVRTSTVDDDGNPVADSETSSQWRMRISLEKADGDVKATNVEFVS
ncbi:mammalian cell entry protein [Mycolicibacterium sp. XJ1819]